MNHALTACTASKGAWKRQLTNNADLAKSKISGDDAVVCLKHGDRHQCRFLDGKINIYKINICKIEE